MTAPLPTPFRTLEEEPLYLPVDDHVVFGVSARPAGGGLAAGVVCVHTGIDNMSAHRNGVWADLCRRAASRGLHTLRIDPRGFGDSTGAFTAADTAQGAALEAAEDVAAAARYLTSQGVESVFLLGSCWASGVCLYAAPKVDAFAGASLISFPMTRALVPEHLHRRGGNAAPLGAAVRSGLQTTFARRLLTEPRYRAFVLARMKMRVRLEGRRLATSARERLGRRPPDLAGGEAAPARPGDPFRAIAQLAELMNRSNPIQLVYGAPDQFYKDFVTATQEGGLLAAEVRRPNVEVTVLPMSVHNMDSIESQREVVAVTVEWLASAARTAAGGSAS